MTRHTAFQEQRPIANDGLVAPDVGIWSLDKWAYLRHYCEIFASAMHNKWHTVYLDLYCGGGVSRIIRDGSDAFFQSSPLLALGVKKPFDKYVFMDENKELIAALRTRVNKTSLADRVTIFPGSFSDPEDLKKVIRTVNASASIAGQPPLVFTFLDPYDLSIPFKSIEVLASTLKSDLLILLALQMDAQRNLKYYLSPSNNKIEKFLDDADWRLKWTELPSQKSADFLRFLEEEFRKRVNALGYIDAQPPLVEIKNTQAKGIYYLAFFTRHTLGRQFWGRILSSSERQRSLL